MNTKTTSNTENATIDRIIEGAFIHAMDSCLNDENKEAGRNLANRFNTICLENEGEVPDGSPLMIIAQGFILGLNEGLNIAAAIDECAER